MGLNSVELKIFSLPGRRVKTDLLVELPSAFPAKKRDLTVGRFLLNMDVSEAGLCLFATNSQICNKFYYSCVYFSTNNHYERTYEMYQFA